MGRCPTRTATARRFPRADARLGRSQNNFWGGGTRLQCGTVFEDVTTVAAWIVCYTPLMLPKLASAMVGPNSIEWHPVFSWEVEGAGAMGRVKHQIEGVRIWAFSFLSPWYQNYYEQAGVRNSMLVFLIKPCPLIVTVLKYRLLWVILTLFPFSL